MQENVIGHLTTKRKKNTNITWEKINDLNDMLLSHWYN